MPPIFNILQIVNLVNIITIINIIKIIIFTIATTTIIAVSYRKKSIIFVAKKVITLISIQKMSNRKQKNFRDKTGNFVKIKTNTMHFALIIKRI